MALQTKHITTFMCRLVPGSVPSFSEHFLSIQEKLCVSNILLHRYQTNIRVVVSVSNVSVLRRSRGIVSNVSVSSLYRHSKVSSRSRLLTSRLHRTSKFTLRTVTIKFSILYRDTSE